MSIALAAVAIGGADAPRADAANVWRATASLADARADHTATLLPDGRVLVAGGRADEPLTAPLASAELYDPATATWTTAPAMGVARSGHTATLLTEPGCAPHCGKVLVVGGSAAQDGMTPGEEVTATAELFDPATQTWAATAGPLGTGRTRHTASLLRGIPCQDAAPPAWCGKVLVAGGQAAGTTGELATAELFDPASGQWAPTGSLGTARQGHSATVLRDGSVLLVGGRNHTLVDPMTNPDPTLPSAERYDPAGGGWSAAGSTAIRRYLHTATLMADGRVLVVGGVDGFDSPRRSAELYDPLSPANPWPAQPVTPAMAEGRGSHTATLFPDGTLLVVGGGGPSVGGRPSVDRSTSERFSPSVRGWALDAPLVTGRRRHTATLLAGPGCGASCGRLLVVGGLRQTTTFLASAELLVALPRSPPPPRAPAARSVTDLAARALSSRRISLTFSAPSPGGDANRPATRYVVKQSRHPITAASFDGARSLCGGTCSFRPGRAGDRVTLEVSGLVPDRLYHYALRPLDGVGRAGMLSNIVRARTRKDILRPGPPRGLSARAIGRGRVRLRFRAPASDGRAGPPVRRFVLKQATRPIRGSRGFRKARSLCRGSCRFAAARVGARLTLIVRGLCAGRRSYYAVRAKDEGGNLSRVARFRVVRARGSGARGC